MLLVINKLVPRGLGERVWLCVYGQTVVFDVEYSVWPFYWLDFSLKKKPTMDKNVVNNVMNSRKKQ